MVLTNLAYKTLGTDPKNKNCTTITHRHRNRDPNILPHYTHTVKHRIHDDCGDQLHLPHSKHREKQPKSEKQTIPKPQVWCGILLPPIHTKRTKRIFRVISPYSPVQIPAGHRVLNPLKEIKTVISQHVNITCFIIPAIHQEGTLEKREYLR
jgi:hypothetical protein